MGKINLDQMRAARAETAEKTKTPKAVFKGKTFTLPAELPFGVFLRLGELQDDEKSDEALEIMRSVVVQLFGKRADEFLDLGPSLDDLMALMGGLTEAYDLDPKALAASQES